jgi:hypothetical protein
LSEKVTDPRIESPSDEILLIREKISKSEEEKEKNEKNSKRESSETKNWQRAGEISRNFSEMWAFAGKMIFRRVVVNLWEFTLIRFPSDKYSITLLRIVHVS